MITLVLGIIIGGIITWYVAHAYYKKAYHDQEALYNKFSSNLREWILADTRRHLSVPDLNQMLEEKTIDKDSDYPFPYKACPKCGSDNIYRGKDADADVDVGDEGEAVFTPIYYKAMQCEECGWQISEINKT